MLTINGGFPGPTIHVRKGNRAYVMSTMKQAMVSLFTGDGSLSLSLSLHTIQTIKPIWRERKEKKKNLTLNNAFGLFFFEKRTIFFFLSEVYLVKVDKTIEK